jgi:hypothetical protein
VCLALFGEWQWVADEWGIAFGGDAARTVGPIAVSPRAYPVRAPAVVRSRGSLRIAWVLTDGRTLTDNEPPTPPMRLGFVDWKLRRML